MTNPDYAKGYAAGRRRADKGRDAGRRAALREEFERQVFIAILPELVARPWLTNGVRWTDQGQFIDGALSFARGAAKKFDFPLQPETASGEGS